MLANKGYTPTAIDTLVPKFREMGYKVYAASDKARKATRLIDMLRAVMKLKKSVDVVLIDTYSTAAFYYAWVVARLCRVYAVKYIPILHGGNLPKRMEHSPVLSVSLLKHSYCNVVVSDYMQHILENKGINAIRIENAIDIPIYPFRQRGMLQPRLLWVRSFDSIYQPEMAIRVFGKIQEAYPDAILNMVGPDKDGSLQACKALASELGISDKITFTGKLSKQEWIAIAASHDVFLNTAKIDNLPVSVIEAMALGLIVVSTKVGGIPYLIADGKNGYTVPVNDIEAMAEKVLDILQSDKSKISTNARQSAEQYSWENIQPKWQQLFMEVVSER